MPGHSKGLLRPCTVLALPFCTVDLSAVSQARVELSVSYVLATWSLKLGDQCSKQGQWMQTHGQIHHAFKALRLLHMYSCRLACFLQQYLHVSEP